MKQRSNAFLAGRMVVVAMGLAACRDIIPPTVGSTSPTDDSTEVDTSAVITATFDENILATTVDGTSFTLQDNVGDVSGTVSFDSASNVATFTPTALGLARQYTATLTKSITDLAGNALASNYSWKFTTRDGSWGTAALIETDEGDAGKPQIAFDANGNALAVWHRGGIWSNRYVAGSGWGTAVLIGTYEAGDASEPQVAIDANGNALAVWIQHITTDNGVISNIGSNRYVAGTGWGTAVMIDDDNAAAYSPVGDPHVAVDPRGNAVVVWDRNDGTRRNIWSNRYMIGSGWGTAELIETGTGDASESQVAIDANGNALAVWTQSATTTSNIWSNRYVAGTGWETAVLIDTDTMGDAFAPADTPQVAFDASGNAVVVWSKSGDDTVNIWANHYVAGTGWGTAELVETITGYASYPQVALDGSGNALAVWKHIDGSGTNIWFNRYVVSSGWGTAELIAENAGESEIAVDPSGNAVLVWGKYDGSRNNIWSNRYVAGTGWGTAALIETDYTVNAFDPQVAIDANGNALAVWTQGGVLLGTRTTIIPNSIWANRFD